MAPGREREFEEAFRARGVLALARDVARLRTGELLRPLRSGDPYVVVATWDSAAPLSEPVAPADLYEIVEAYRADAKH